jgi:hypothetical protein
LPALSSSSGDFEIGSNNYFWFDREVVVTAFQERFAANIGPDIDNAIADLSRMIMPTAVLPE